MSFWFCCIRNNAALQTPLYMCLSMPHWRFGMCLEVELLGLCISYKLELGVFQVLSRTCHSMGFKVLNIFQRNCRAPSQMGGPMGTIQASYPTCRQGCWQVTHQFLSIFGRELLPVVSTPLPLGAKPLAQRKSPGSKAQPRGVL